MCYKVIVMLTPVAHKAFVAEIINKRACGQAKL